jgi:hypothetical protein
MFHSPSFFLLLFPAPGPLGECLAPQLDWRETLTQKTVSDPYQAYTMVAVNNGHYAAFDPSGALWVIFIGPEGIPVVLQELAIGQWVSHDLGSVSNSAQARTSCRNPGIRWSESHGLSCAWLEQDSQNAYVVLAQAALDEHNQPHSWSRHVVASYPFSAEENQAKYLCFDASDESHLLGFTSGQPDLYARVFAEWGELPQSPLTSGLGSMIKSSDITIAAEGKRAILLWEENWSGYGRGKEAHLVFCTSEDGGMSWSEPAHVLGQETLGGDASVCISQGTVYASWHRVTYGPGSGASSNFGTIFAAKMAPGEAAFSLLELQQAGEPGSVGKGWLPCTGCAGDRVVIAWEASDGAYPEKDQHAYAFSFWDTQETTPVLLSEDVEAKPENDLSFYDSTANVLVHPLGHSLELFWIGVELLNADQAVLSLQHRHISLLP